MADFGFGKLDEILDRAAKVDEAQAWLEVIDREMQWEIIRLNTQDQLFDEGLLSNGLHLPDYSRASVDFYGKREGHIQLKDTGAFYSSFIVRADKNGIEIQADSEKGLSPKDDLVVRYGIDILGLTEENKGVISRSLIEKYADFIRERLF